MSYLSRAGNTLWKREKVKRFSRSKKAEVLLLISTLYGKSWTKERSEEIVLLFPMPPFINLLTEVKGVDVVRIGFRATCRVYFVGTFEKALKKRRQLFDGRIEKNERYL